MTTPSVTCGARSTLRWTPCPSSAACRFRSKASTSPLSPPTTTSLPSLPTPATNRLAGDNAPDLFAGRHPDASAMRRSRTRIDRYLSPPRVAKREFTPESLACHCAPQVPPSIESERVRPASTLRSAGTERVQASPAVEQAPKASAASTASNFTGATGTLTAGASASRWPGSLHLAARAGSSRHPWPGRLEFLQRIVVGSLRASAILPCAAEHVAAIRRSAAANAGVGSAASCFRASS